MKQTLTDNELAVFSGQLSMILHSGISVLEGILILKDDAESEDVREILSSVYEALEETGELAPALQSSGVFPEYFVRMTELGEKSGTLEEVMASLSEYFSRQHTVLRSIRDTLTYPLILFGMLSAVLIVLITQVMPVFEEVFEQLGIEVRGITGTIFRLGNLLRNSAAALLFIVIAALLFCIFSLRTENGKRLLLTFLKKLPFIKNIFRLLSCARFASALSISLHSGLDIDESFSIAAGLTDQEDFLACLKQAETLISEGTDLGEALRSTGVFTGLNARMFSIGFRTGSPETALSRISADCQDEADNRIQSSVNALEPALTAILSILAGAVLISVMLPLLSVMTNIG